jgi:polyisoprenoid-binding protein YceI
MMDTINATPIAYAIDPGVSRFSARVSASGLLSMLGHNPTIAIRGFTGDLQCAPDSLEDARVSVRIDPTRFAVQDSMSDRDRREIEQVMKEQVLETDRFPEITFDSTRISAAAGASVPPTVQVTGRLRLHGVARDLSFSAQVVRMGDMIRSYGDLSLRQTDYGIALVSVAAGGLKVKDEVSVSFDIVARKRG